jgi:catechol 2,3-dioxygenase-like lactoylglutathione lyase family enzyme
MLAESFKTADRTATYGVHMTPSPAPIVLTHIEIVVADMAAALAFYRDLGLDVDPEADSAPHAEAVLPSGVRVAWDTVTVIRASEPNWAPPQGGHAMALAFDCGAPARVDAEYARMLGLGHHGHQAPFDAFWGQRYASLADPDGNPIDLFAALPAKE